MTKTENYSKVKIIGNYTPYPHDPSRPPFNELTMEYLKDNGAISYFERKAVIKDKLREVLFGLDTDGQFIMNEDKDIILFALPCPPYCPDDKDGILLKRKGVEYYFNNFLDRIREIYNKAFCQNYNLIAPFIPADVEKLNENYNGEKKAKGFLNIKIMLSDDSKERNAIIGLDSNGIIMNGDKDVVVYED